jgi:hypothetical protein
MSGSHFAELKSAFKGDLVTPTDPDYPQAISRWAKNAARKAKLVAFVKDEEDVSLTLKYIKDTGLPFTVRGGAHSVSGASSCEGGVVIDLSRHLNRVRVDPERKLAYVGGGAQGQDVDKAAIEYGLAGVVGTANDVRSPSKSLSESHDLSCPTDRCRRVCSCPHTLTFSLLSILILVLSSAVDTGTSPAPMDFLSTM